MIPIVIPAYEPDERLLKILDELNNAGQEPIILVNDGSGKEYDHYYEEARNKYNCVVLKHAVNMGKGRALKTAFNYVLNEYDQLEGVVTADSDGQHTVECIIKCKNELIANKDSLILGVRDFKEENIPWKSRFGNVLTSKICKFLCGLNVTDTQTGLRGIPKGFMKVILNTQGERFEYETRMLLETKDICDIREVKIKTVYDSKENHATHFDPVRDSVRIYKIFGGIFVKYIFSSLSSCVLDLALFALFAGLLAGWSDLYDVTVATVLARVISATYNYLINYKFVFASHKNRGVSVVKYFTLAVIQMTLSATLVTLGAYFIIWLPKVVIKVIVDSVLFFVSYHVQQKYIF